MDIIKLNTKDLKNYIKDIRCGDEVLLSGTVFTARDAAHKRILECIEKGFPLPFDLQGAAVYYAGPTPEKKGHICGSFGPTTSSRMDIYSPKLLDLGLLCMIGKGPRNQEVIDSIIRNSAIYFCAIGGAGALASRCITSLEVVAYHDLGCESVKKLEFCDFPLICGIDHKGRNIF